MNRDEFLKRLEILLMQLPEYERLDALAYYEDYFNEAGEENEQQVIRELGSPQKVAESIMADYRASNYQTSGDYREPEENLSIWQKCRNWFNSIETWQKVLIIVLLIFTFPVWIGLAASLFGAVFGLLGGLFGLVFGLLGTAIGLFIGGIALMIGGIIALAVARVEGLAMMGVGAFLAAAGVLIFVLFFNLTFVAVPKIFKIIKKWFKSDRHSMEGGNEI